MYLRHLKLPGITPYTHAADLQNRLVSSFLSNKASPLTTPSPQPTIITTQFPPVYTCGRREIGTVSPSQKLHLEADGKASFYEALRGGQTTFHGPGQLVAYPILDLKQHALTPRCYIRLLENAVISTLATYGIKGFTTENPGVWTSNDEKICAVGVHLRRNITSFGIGLNVFTDLAWFDRIVACGLEGKRTVSLRSVGVDVGVETVSEVFVGEMARALKNVEDVKIIDEDELD